MKFLAAAAGALALCLTSAASADTQSIAAPGLHAIEASGPLRLQIVTGATPSVVLEGSRAHLDRVQASFTRGVLRLNGRCNFNCDPGELEVVVRVTAAELDRLEFSKGAQGSAAGIQSDRLQIDVSMGATLEIVGSCNHLNANVAMGGQLSARALRCREANVDASMGGTAQVSATERINADANMGGQIDVSGSPTARSDSAFMGGSVTIQ